MRERCREAALRRLHGQAASPSEMMSSDPISNLQPEGQRQDETSEPSPSSGNNKASSSRAVSTGNDDVIDLEEDFDQGMQINGVHGSWVERQKDGGSVQGKMPAFRGYKDRTSQNQAVICPVCNQSWKNLSNAEFNQHIDACLSDEVCVID